MHSSQRVYLGEVNPDNKKNWPLSIDNGQFDYPIFFFIENFKASLYSDSNFAFTSLACSPS